MRLLLSIFTAGIASAQSFSLPLVGIARDETNRLRPVYGMAGNFISGQASGEVVISMAFSGKAGLAKTETQLLLFDETGAAVDRYPAPPGIARFAFDANRAPAFCYFESTGELWRIAENGLELVTTPELEPGAQALLSNAHGKDGLALTIAGGLVSAAAAGLIWQADGASPIEIPLAGEIRSLEQIGDGWVRVASADGAYALQIPSGRLYRLPVAGKLK